jgi:hypothetical protein
LQPLSTFPACATSQAAKAGPVGDPVGFEQESVRDTPYQLGDGLRPKLADSIAAMSIFFMVIIASNARFAAMRSGSDIAAIRARGVICHDSPHRSLHQPHALSWPPLRTIAFHKRSVSAWSSVVI